MIYGFRAEPNRKMKNAALRKRGIFVPAIELRRSADVGRVDAVLDARHAVAQFVDQHARILRIVDGHIDQMNPAAGEGRLERALDGDIGLRKGPVGARGDTDAWISAMPQAVERFAAESVYAGRVARSCAQRKEG